MRVVSQCVVRDCSDGLGICLVARVCFSSSLVLVDIQAQLVMLAVRAITAAQDSLVAVVLDQLDIQDQLA